MQRTLLLYNPASGQSPARRLAEIERAAAVLRSAGVKVELEPTHGPGMAGEQARNAARSGFDTVIACGGDGTIHDVLQGMAGNTQVAMGVLPLGTANALATDLGIPRDPEAAARLLLQYRPRTLAAGRIESRQAGRTRAQFFTVMSGVGPDAHLIYKLSAGFKQRFGVSAYVVQAGWEYMWYHYAPFQAQYRDAHTGELHSETVAQIMAVRIDDFGAPLRHFVRGARLENNFLRLVLFKEAIRLTYPAYLIQALLGLNYPIPGVKLVDAVEITCTELPPEDASPRKVYSEADGELLGGLPVYISIVPNTFTLLMRPI